jgi:predicted methyltransferase
VVQHRTETPGLLPSGKINGYVSEAQMIELAEAAGFVLEARSDINANPKDNHQHPAGVWTLPPTLRLGEENRQTYVQIGESDRMTLRFRKPRAEPK